MFFKKNSKKLRPNQKVLKIQSAATLITYRMQAGGGAGRKLRDLAKQTGNLKNSLRTLANYRKQIKQFVYSRVTTAWDWKGFSLKFKL